MGMNEMQKEIFSTFDTDFMDLTTHASVKLKDLTFRAEITGEQFQLKEVFKLIDFDFEDGCRILRNNGLIDENNVSTDKALLTGWFTNTPLKNTDTNAS